MKFKFELTEIACKQTLSNNDAWWGANDGLQIHFLMSTSKDNEGENIVSGYDPKARTLGRSDDNIPFYKGKILKMNSVIPLRGGNNWETEVYDISEHDTLNIVIIGVNKGLPFISGGGGFGKGDELFKTLIKLFGKIPVAGASKISEGTLMVIDFINKHVNDFEDCRGISFGFSTELKGRDLITFMLKSQRNIKLLKLSNDLNPLPLNFIHNPSSSNKCNTPNYDVTLNISIMSQLRVDINEDDLFIKKGPDFDFNPLLKSPCEIKRNTTVWINYFNKTLTLNTDFKFDTIKIVWNINGVDIRNSSGMLNIENNVSLPMGISESKRKISIKYQLESIEPFEELKLFTNAEDGNYEMNISLKLRFSESEDFIVYKNWIIYIHGQRLEGDEKYQEWLQCDSKASRTLHRKIARLVGVRGYISPIEPISFINIRNEIFNMSKVKKNKTLK